MVTPDRGSEEVRRFPFGSQENWVCPAIASVTFTGRLRTSNSVFVAVGLIQLGMWRVAERLPVRIVASASLLFAAGVAIQAATQGSGSDDAFHRSSPGPAVENVLVALLYALLLYRESRTATA